MRRRTAWRYCLQRWCFGEWWGRCGARPSPPANAAPRHSSLRLLSWWAAFAIVTAALSLTKFAYFPLLAFLLLIPPARAGGSKKYLAALVALVVINLAVLIAWGSQSHGLDTVLRDQPDVSPRRQVQYLRTHPSALITVPASTFARDGWRVFRSFVGRLGSMDTPMSVFFILGYVAAIVVACWLQDDRPPLRRQRHWLPLSFFPYSCPLRASRYSTTSTGPPSGPVSSRGCRENTSPPRARDRRSYLGAYTRTGITPLGTNRRAQAESRRGGCGADRLFIYRDCCFFPVLLVSFLGEPLMVHQA